MAALGLLLALLAGYLASIYNADQAFEAILRADLILCLIALNTLGRPVSSKVMSSRIILAIAFPVRKIQHISPPLNPAMMN